MFLNIIALITAVTISAVAAYYSIVGLTAVFSGVFIPIIIMGGALEVGKIVTTVWLHTYWKDLRWFLKWYMTAAVIVLMFITSMGIFGFLSRAHIEVTSQAGSSYLLIQQVDQSIALEQKRIEDSRAVIKQLDDSVTSLLQGSASNAVRDNNRTAQLTAQATKLRQSQKKERDALMATIDDANKRIAVLSKDKLKLEQDKAKIEAEVGPVKYIAQLIYGDTVNKDLLERAVRWVIIIIVAVFDPLAVAMVLGVTMVLNARKNRKTDEPVIEERVVEVERIVEVPVEKIVEVERVVEVPVEKVVTQAVPIFQDKIVEVPVEVEKIVEIEKIVEKEVPVEVIKEVEVERIVEVPVDRVQVEYVTDPALVTELNEQRDRAEQAEVELAEVLATVEQLRNEEPKVIEKIVEVEKPIEVIKEKIIEIEKPIEKIVEVERIVEREVPVEVIKEIEKIVEIEKPVEVIREVEVIKQDDSKIKELESEIENLKKQLEPKQPANIPLALGDALSAKADGAEPNAPSGFGTEFPANPQVGQLFLRVDTIPNTLYKWNGVKWIQVDKNQNTSYVNNERLISTLMDKLRAGEIEWEDLTPAEQDAIMPNMKKEQFLGQ